MDVCSAYSAAGLNGRSRARSAMDGVRLPHRAVASPLGQLCFRNRWTRPARPQTTLPITTATLRHRRRLLPPGRRIRPRDAFAYLLIRAAATSGGPALTLVHGARWAGPAAARSEPMLGCCMAWQTAALRLRRSARLPPPSRLRLRLRLSLRLMLVPTSLAPRLLHEAPFAATASRQRNGDPALSHRLYNLSRVNHAHAPHPRAQRPRDAFRCSVVVMRGAEEPHQPEQRGALIVSERMHSPMRRPASGIKCAPPPELACSYR